MRPRQYCPTNAGTMMDAETFEDDAGPLTNYVRADQVAGLEHLERVGTVRVIRGVATFQDVNLERLLELDGAALYVRKPNQEE